MSSNYELKTNDKVCYESFEMKSAFKKFLKMIYSLDKIYERDENFVVKSLKKQITIFGFKFTINSKLPKHIRFLNDEIRTFLILKNSNNILKDLGYIQPRDDIENVFNSNEEKDIKKIKDLYSNLDYNAINNLNEILNRNKRAVTFLNQLNKFPKAKEIYTKDELKELSKIDKFENEIEVFDDYYKYKDYILPINFFEPSVFLNEHGIGILKNKNAIGDGVIIDVGANTGDSALVFRKRFPKNKIICFEPSDKNRDYCNKTISLNNLDNVIVEKTALGDTECKSHIELRGSASCVVQRGGQKINVTTLDKYVKENNIKVGLIKVDIEGFEPNFLRGAQETIRTQAPVILLSMYHNCDDFFYLKPMIEKIMQKSQYKYRYDFYQGVYYTSIAETLLLCERI